MSAAKHRWGAKLGRTWNEQNQRQELGERAQEEGTEFNFEQYVCFLSLCAKNKTWFMDRAGFNLRFFI